MCWRHWPSSPTCLAAEAAGGAFLRSRLTLCLITDRRRLVAATNEVPSDWETLLVEQIAGAVAGGVDVVQIRESSLDDRTYVALVRRVVHTLAATQARVVVNDRVDIALAGGAHGVHLRESSIQVEAARRLAGAGLIIGRSVHSAEGAVRAGSADYLIAGSVFATRSKPGRGASLGLDGLATVVRAAGAVPVWAVGGVTPARLRQIAATGAKGVAAIDAFVPTGPQHEVRARARDRASAFRACDDRTLELL